MRLPDEKAQLNAFLGEYLALCLAQASTPSPSLGQALGPVLGLA